MKTVIRTTLIVLASLLVIGGAYAFVEYGGTSWLPTGQGRGEMGELPEGFQPGGDFEAGEGGRPERGEFAPSVEGEGGMNGEGFRRGGGHEEGGLAGLAQVFKNLIVMGVITLVVVVGGVLWRMASRLFRRPTATPPAAPPVA